MVPPPPKASRTLADVAAFVEAEGIAADAAYTEALNAAQAQEGHQVRWEGGGLKVRFCRRDGGCHTWRRRKI